MKHLHTLVLISSSLILACGGSARHKAPGAPEASYAATASEAGDTAAGGSAPAMAAAGVRAGEWDDNANYREFLTLLEQRQGAGFHPVDVRDRQFLVVRDVDGKAVPSCRLTVRDGAGNVARLTTLSSGRATLFPHAEGIASPDIVVEAVCGQNSLRQPVTMTEGEGVIELSLPHARALPARPVVDVVFVLDSTGSMSEEIAGVKDTIRAVAAQLDELGADIRVGLVEFKDRTDDFVTRVYPLSADLQAFSDKVSSIRAGGGGDMPESVNAGLSVAMTQLSWNTEASARLAFLVGDAPPHLDYADDVGYATSMRLAARRGIQIHTIAASGMNLVGQMVWRQVAQYTGGTNLFVLRGGAGPQSVGAGDPESSCGGTQESYTSGNLDQLVLGKLKSAIALIDADPMMIPGLGQDERAKPCAERVIAR